MDNVSVTVNPYIGLRGHMENRRFFPADTEEEYNDSGKFNAEQIIEGYRKRSNKPIDTIVDIGCGNLRIGRFMAGNCKSYVGLDISPAVIESASNVVKTYGLFNANLAVTSDFKGENMADLVICFQVVQHNPAGAQIEIMENIRRILKPGAWACIHLPKLENKPDYVNYDTCMCFTCQQVEEFGAHFDRFEFEEQTLLPGWDVYYLWVQKEA